MSKLTPKQERFCEEYLVDLNGGRAYIRAGYSKKGADQSASRLLRNAKIVRRINELRDKQRESTHWDAQWVRDKLVWLANEASERGQLGVLKGTLDIMSKVEALQTQNHQVDGRTGITFNIKTGKK